MKTLTAAVVAFGFLPGVVDSPVMAADRAACCCREGRPGRRHLRPGRASRPAAGAGPQAAPRAGKAAPLAAVSGPELIARLQDDGTRLAAFRELVRRSGDTWDEAGELELSGGHQMPPDRTARVPSSLS